MARVRRSIRVSGAVQGLGFRPWAARLATALELAGFVRNAGAEVEIELEGEQAAVDAWLATLAAAPPAGARVDATAVAELRCTGASGFRVGTSVPAPIGRPALPADRPLCDACRAELFDCASRRHRYAFGHCAACGPRASIATGLPWDRARTTLAGFAPCAACRAEYADPSDRRFHAETIACPACGPTLRAWDASGAVLGGDAIEHAAAVLRAGAVVALLGGGGAHLAVDATRRDAVARLRKRKQRPAKPFAVVVPDLAAARAWVELRPEDEALLAGPTGAVVLAPRRAEATRLAPEIAPGLADLGVALPFSPIEWLLLHGPGTRPGRDAPRFEALVWTSANASGEPTVASPEALAGLGEIADLVVAHDRAVARANDDSVYRSAERGPIPIRLSRSTAPRAFLLPAGLRADVPILGVGGDLKAAPALAHCDTVTLGEHVGDLACAAASDAWRARAADLCRLVGLVPALAAHDLHPDGFGRALAAESAPRAIGVQHHHAHAAAALVEHGSRGPVLALALDGFGWGADGGAWGGELLACDLVRCERVTHFEPVALPGGDAAAREPWRMAVAWCLRAGRVLPLDLVARVGADTVERVRRLAARAPTATTSCGRLFDAVGALLECGALATYEGEVAMRLEACASAAPESRDAPLRDAAVGAPIEVAPLVREVLDGLARGTPRAVIARAFHDGLADRVAAAAVAHARARGLAAVVLTGGCFQNRLLDARVARRIAASGIEPLRHRVLPPGDGALAVGQATIAAARLAGW